MYDSFTFEHKGRSFLAELHHDPDTGAPWEEQEGHGHVSDWVTRDKAPGEMVLLREGQHARFYAFEEACARAREEGWDSAPYNQGQESEAEQAAKAARADFEYLRAWCIGEWHWCGVIVKPVCACCGNADDSRAESLWGIESWEAFPKEAARELADMMIA